MAVVTEIGSERCRSREVCRWRDIEIFQNLELSRALNPTYWPSAQRHCPSSWAAKQMKIRVWVVSTLKMGQCKQCGEEQLHVAANSCYPSTSVKFFTQISRKCVAWYCIPGTRRCKLHWSLDRHSGVVLHCSHCSPAALQSCSSRRLNIDQQHSNKTLHVQFAIFVFSSLYRYDLVSHLMFKNRSCSKQELKIVLLQWPLEFAIISSEGALYVIMT